MSENKNDTWIHRGLDVGLAVNAEDTVDVTVLDRESGMDLQLTFKRDEREEMIRQIGEEIHSWITLMIDQIDDEEFDN